jgi:ABC-type uncharacterized transport system permease subunit
MERSSDMSREMVLVIQGIIILLVTAEKLMPIVQKRISSRKPGGGQADKIDDEAVSGTTLAEGGD